MTAHAAGYTIGEIIDQNPELVVGTFSPQIGDLSDLFGHARKICNKFVVGKYMPHAAIALAVPVLSQDGKSMINFPVFDVHELFRNNDPTIEKHIEDAKVGRLNISPLKSTVGTAMAFLTGAMDGLTDNVKTCLQQDTYIGKDNTWLYLSSPHERYSECYTASTNNNTPKYNLIRPILLEKGALFAAVGIDCMKLPTPEELEHLSLILDNLHRLLAGTYWSYYTHFDPPPVKPKDIRSQMKQPWPWDTRGRVLGPHYLRRIETEVSNTQKVRSAERVVVLYCDGNGTKKINESLGHAVGNEALRILGSALWKAMIDMCFGTKRRCDDGFVVRWGGDEFVVILCKPQSVNSNELVNVFCELVRNFLGEATNDLNKVLKEVSISALPEDFGVSIGWSEWSADQNEGKTFNEVWSKDAEQAMYCCKAMSKIAAELKHYDFLKIGNNDLYANAVSVKGAGLLKKWLIRELGIKIKQ